MVGGGTLSYRELDDAAARVAGMLHDQGVRPGDRVAIMVPSGPDFLRAWAGVGRLGAVAVVLNCELKGTFLANPLVDSGARFFVVDPPFVVRLEGLRSEERRGGHEWCSTFRYRVCADHE